MKRPRTVFGPFALICALAIGFALGRFDPASQPERAEFTKGSKHRTQPQPQQQASQREARAQSPLLIVPVQGIARTQLTDTWGHSRSEGRTHEGIDILAPEGT